MARRRGKHEAVLPATQPTVNRLTILYDEHCALCRRVREWLRHQPCRVPVEILPAGSATARERFPQARSWLAKGVVVADDHGRTWVGPEAYLVALWATARYRHWSYLLARPALAPLAGRFFLFVSKRRHRLGAWFGREDPDCSWCDELRMTRAGSI